MKMGLQQRIKIKSKSKSEISQKNFMTQRTLVIMNKINRKRLKIQIVIKVKGKEQKLNALMQFLK